MAPTWGGGATGTDKLASFRIRDGLLISVTTGGAVTEGEDAVFTVSRSGPTDAALTLNLTVAEAAHSDFVDTKDEGGKSVTIPGGRDSVIYRVATVDDNEDKINGEMTVTVGSSSNYHLVTLSASVTVIDNDPTTVKLAKVVRGLIAYNILREGRSMKFTVRLRRGLVQGEVLEVPLVFGGTATRNTDYTVSCPSALPTGVTCQDLNNVSEGNNPRVTFTGTSSGATATLVTLTLTAAADNIEEGGPGLDYQNPSGAESVTIDLGNLNDTGVMELGGGATRWDDLNVFSITDPSRIRLCTSQPYSRENNPCTTTIDVVKEGSWAPSLTTAVFFFDRALYRLYQESVSLTVKISDISDRVLYRGSAEVTFRVSRTESHYQPVVDNDIDEPTRVISVRILDGDPYSYKVVEPSSNSVTVIDDDPTPVVLGRNGTGAIAENGGTAIIIVSLGRRLYGEESVTVPLAVSGTGISASDYTLLLSSGDGLNEGVTLSTAAPHSTAEPAVVFTGHDSNTVQVATLTLTAINDNVDEGAAESLSIAFGIDDGVNDRRVTSNLDRVSGTGTGGTSPSGTVTVVITDDDGPPALVFSPSALTVTEGSSNSYTVKLSTQPTGTVTVTVGGVTAEVTVDTNAVTEGDQNSLTFSTSDWNTGKTVTVSAGQDDDAVNDVVTLAHTAAGGGYNTIEDDLEVTVTDDDTAALVFSPSALTVTEGSSNSYTVKLSTQPTGTVTVTVGGVTAEVTVDTNSGTQGNQNTSPSPPPTGTLPSR